MIIPPFDPAAALMVGAFIAPQPQEPAVAQAAPEHTLDITPRDVAVRLYEKGFVAATLPKREPQLAAVIVEAYADTNIRLGDLPARRRDFTEIRKQLDLITRQAERYGRSLECERYRAKFVKPVGRL